MSLSLFLNVCSKFSPGFDVQVFHNQVFQRVFGLQIVFGVSSIFGWLYFSRCVASLHLRWVVMRFGFCVCGENCVWFASEQAASSAAAFGGLAASSLFLVWKRKNRMGER